MERRTLTRRAREEGWFGRRKAWRREAAENRERQSAAEAELEDGGIDAAERMRLEISGMDETAIVSGIRRKALWILDRMFDGYAEVTATEQRFSEGGVTNVRKLRDMTAIFKELAGNRAKSNDVEDLGPLEQLLRGDEEEESAGGF